MGKEQKNRRYPVMIVVLGLLALTLALLWMLTRPVDAHAALTAEIRVCPAGCDYASIQDAVDNASEDDIIKVATGVYTGLQSVPVPPGYLNPPASGLVTQTVYLSKSLTIQGGYTTTDWLTPDPVANPTIVDAQNQGRAMLIAGNISPTIAGLHFTGGNATGLGGYSGVNWPPHDTGGGLCVVSATATISNNVVSNNTAGSFGSGGGMYLLYSDAVLRNNTVTTNTANSLYGGGLYTMYSDATLTGNTYSGNSAGWGGAVFLEFSPATLVSNTFTGNSCIMAGGALNVHTSNALIAENNISNNMADVGGGLRLYDSAATIDNNVISANTATDFGGGLHLWISPSTLTRNTITGNSANSTAGAIEFWLSDATLINNLIADNHASEIGTGLYIIGESSPRLLHNTIARNVPSGGGDSSGIYVDYYQAPCTLWLTNTILVSHTIGISVSTDNVASLEATHWGNDIDWNGDGTIVTGTINVWGNPAFVDPDAGDYHLGSGSVAINAGVNAGVFTDIDGEPRPAGAGYDIGADEFLAGLIVTKQASTDLAQAGAPLTYTIHITNNDAIPLNALVTDVLPLHVIPTGTRVWTPPPLLPGDDWSETFVVTIETGYHGSLVNVVQVTTEEGPSGMYTNTVDVEEAIAGLSATNDSPSMLGNPTTLTATITAGSNVVYAWAFDDGSLGSGSVVTHTYANAGVYTAVVTASNPVSQFTATTTVTIIEPGFSVYLPLVLRNH